MMLDLQPRLAGDGLCEIAGEIEIDLGGARAQAGVDPEQGGGRQPGQPGVHLLSDQPGGPIEPTLRRPREELEVGGHRAVRASSG